MRRPPVARPSWPPPSRIFTSRPAAAAAFSLNGRARAAEVELGAANGTRWLQPLGLFIHNEFVDGLREDRIATLDPYTERELCSVAAASAADVDRAVASSRAALQHASWRAASGPQRGRLLSRLADLVDAHRHTLATIETVDNGKPLSASLGYDLPHAAEVLRYYAGFADKMHGSAFDGGLDRLALTMKQPVGVCGLIIPWNYPLAMAAWKLGPALCCGNAVVLKPAEQTPLSALYLARLVREAGFPPGVVNIVNGRGPAAGAALARHPHVDKIAFTGSTETAIEVARTAAATMKSVTLEAGGKSPIIVFDDADLPQAVRWAHEGVMANQGQVCSATSRLLVQDGVHDAFVEALVAYTAQRSVLGDPFDQATYQGPQVSAAQRDRVLSYIAQARAAGATVTHPVGPVSALPRRGFFAPPTIFTDVPPAAGAVFRDEIFGPCAAVMRFGTEDEAVAAANGSRYGLAAAVMTRDLARAHRLGRRLEAGTVWINSSNDTDVRVPFGGVKQSGLGRELGEEGLRPYYTLKAVHVNLTGA